MNILGPVRTLSAGTALVDRRRIMTKMNQVPDENVFTDAARLLEVLTSIPTIHEKPTKILEGITHMCHADSRGTLVAVEGTAQLDGCLLYTSPSPRDRS